MHKLISKCDFIIHLAGEVKPSSSDEEFRKSNVTLTKLILDILEYQKICTCIINFFQFILKIIKKTSMVKQKEDSEMLWKNILKKKSKIVLYIDFLMFLRRCKENKLSCKYLDT